MALPENFMARLAATKGDPSAFSELVFGTPFHRGQRRNAEEAVADVNFLLPGNSWGKTEYLMRKAVYDSWHKEDDEFASFEEWLKAKHQSLIASYNYNVAKESFERLDLAYKNREEVRAIVAKIAHTDPVAVEFTNGSSLYWGSLDGKGKLVEAKRLKRVYVDEVGHIPDLSYTFDNVLFPRTMGVGGKIYLLGTPKEYSDPYLMEISEKGKDGKDPFYFSQSGSVLENEFWPEEERQRVLRNPRYVTGWERNHPETEACENLACRDGMHPVLTPVGRQVINGEFILAGGFFFNRFHIARLFEWSEDWPQPEWHGENHFHIPPKPGRLYFSAYDLGGNRPRKKRKKGSDATVGMTIDYTDRPWKVVCYDYIEGGDADWEDKYDLMANTFKTYPQPYLLIDATGQVDSVQEALQNRGVEVEGIHFGGASSKKYNMLRNLQLCTEMQWVKGTRGILRCPLVPRFKYELDHYIMPDEDIQQDTIMTAAMLCDHIMQFEAPDALAGEIW